MNDGWKLKEIAQTADKALNQVSLLEHYPSLIVIIDSCLLFGHFHHVDIGMWVLYFFKVLIHSLSLKYSTSGLIYLDCLTGNKLIELD